MDDLKIIFDELCVISNQGEKMMLCGTIGNYNSITEAMNTDLEDSFFIHHLDRLTKWKGWHNIINWEEEITVETDKECYVLENGRINGMSAGTNHSHISALPSGEHALINLHAISTRETEEKQFNMAIIPTNVISRIQKKFIFKSNQTGRLWYYVFEIKTSAPTKSEMRRLQRDQDCSFKIFCETIIDSFMSFEHVFTSLIKKIDQF